MSCPSDRVIQSTNDDATYSKAHAVKRGYWKDPYMRYFCPVATSKPPEISRGYFIRTQAFKAITTLFIKTLGCECQVVNLGAGSDTLYFQLKDADIVPRKFVEVDLLHNVQPMNLPPQGDSQSKMNPPAVPDTVLEAQNRHSLVTDTYSLVPFDLRRPVDQLISYLCGPNSSIGLDSNLPTLFLAECVLVYMPSEESFQLIKGLAAHFPHSAFLHYEQASTQFISSFSVRAE
ncbi:leucine carboxyl methyltransferase, partial [Opisthorchis viverrini]